MLISFPLSIASCAAATSLSAKRALRNIVLQDPLSEGSIDVSNGVLLWQRIGAWTDHFW
jgi:hypothetical protein